MATESFKMEFDELWSVVIVMSIFRSPGITIDFFVVEFTVLIQSEWTH